MTQPRFEHRPVDETFLREAPVRVVASAVIPCTADELFAAFRQPAFWKRWLVDKLDWTSPEPFGVGTTRTVKVGPLTADEYFFAWEEGRRFTFYLVRSTMPLFESLAEDYLVEPEGSGSCRFTWIMAVAPRGPALAHAPLQHALRLHNQWAVNRMHKALGR